jgi:hypothetical protein
MLRVVQCVSSVQTQSLASGTGGSK